MKLFFSKNLRYVNSKSTLFALTIVFCISLFSGCAVMIPPSGGPKDTIPPVLVSSDPKDSILNFTGKKIVLTFNEYVNVDNAQMNLIVSPNPKKIPNVTFKLNKITVEIKDTLKPNTTYALDFGRSIKDVNEGNVFRNFTYAFSTGDHLDTDSITGKVVLAQTGSVDTTLIVLLHRNLNDSAVKTLPPDYYTRLDSAGRFSLRFLPNGDYNIFVLPNDYSKQYRDSTELFAFYDQVLHITDTTAPGKILLYAYQEVPEEKKGNGANGGGSNGPENHGNDDNKKKNNKKKEKEQKLKVSANLDNGRQDLLSSFKLSFDRPLKKIDTSLIVLSDTNYHRIEGYHILPDSSDTTNSKFILHYPWKESQYFKLTVDTLAALDSNDIYLAKIDTISFKTKDEADYAGLRLSIPDVDMSQNPVLQFFSNGKEVDSIALDNKKEVRRKLFPPGEYELRVLYDRNKNMRWDPGNYKERKQPEIVEKIKKKFNFKANWDNDQEIYLHSQPK